jgi:endonuclease YncB( thermonuclease family)
LTQGHDPLRKIAATVVLSCIVTIPAFADYVGAVVRITDGDTFVMNVDRDVSIRLCGIDAPERGRAGYNEARFKLSQMILGQRVRCVQVGHGTPCDGKSRPMNRDRIVAQCFVGSTDLASELVESGFACAWPHFSGKIYLSRGACVRP